MQKYWVVLKVSLTRPWVWLMLFFGLFQLFPLALFWSQVKLRDTKVAVPAFDVPEKTVRDSNELKELGEKQQLGTIEGLHCYSLPDNIEFSEQGVLQGPASLRVEPPVPHPLAAWYILDALPQLKSLSFQPPNHLGPEGWQRIGKLHELEVLSLENIGAVDPEAYKTAGADLQSALGQLTNLKQLNVNNTGNIEWTLPPLPKLEYVVLGYNVRMESTLESLAANSPNLHTIALSGYQDTNLSERMLTAIRQMPRLRRLYIVNSTTAKGVDDTGQHVQFLRTRLPRIAVYRGTYSIGRLGVCVFLLIQAMFVSFIVWFQSGLTLAQPLAAVMPGHRRPHLFWPLAASLLATSVFVVGATYVGVYFPAALAFGCMAAMMVATILPGHDLTLEWRRITSTVSTVDVLTLFTLLGIGVGFPLTMDAFLLGDYPVFASLLMVWFLAAAAWKIVRTERLHRILAESGMPGIPGLNMGVQHVFDQPFKPAPGWSMANWQLKRMEHAIDRRIAGMDRTNWVDMLRRASPSNPGLLIGVGMMVVFVVVFQSMPGMKQANAPKAMPYSVGMLQSMMMILMMNTMMWFGRRSSIAADFLRPISRPGFWNALRMAIFHDLKWGVMFGLGWGLFSLYTANKGVLTPLTVAVVLISTAGFFMFYHAWMVLIVICQRLWLVATLAVFLMVVSTMMIVGSAILSFGEEANPPLAILLAVCGLVAGGAMQWGVARKLPDWELG